MTQQIWFVSTVLVALARHMLANRVRPVFAIEELMKWCPEIEKASTARLACRMLWRAGLAEKAPAVDAYDNRNPSAPARWQLTSAGVEAAKAAQAAAAHNNRSKRRADLNATPRTNTLACKVWTVLRTRRTITSQEAADLLGDAGKDNTTLREQISVHLSAWAKLAPTLVQVAEKRVGGRYLRYVLVQTTGLGQHPPTELLGALAKVRKLKKQQAAT